MKTKKLLAFILSAAMCAVSLVSCETKNDKDATTNTDNTQTDNTTATEGLSAYDWLYSDNEVMFTIGGNSVTFEDFRYYAMCNKYYFDYGDDSYWTDITTEDYKQLIVQEFSSLYALKSLCNNELSIVYDEEDKALLDANLNMLKEYYGEEVFSQQLDSMYITEEQFRNLSEFDYLREKLYKEYVSDEEITAYANENYVRVQHVLIGTLDDTGAELPEDELAVKKSLADDIYNKAVGGEDFYSLVEQYGEDPGMEGNPDGYTFTYDYMVKEFEEASFALEVGGISEPVKTSYGYHIIKKLPLDQEYFLNRENSEYLDILYMLGSEKAEAAVAEHLETLEVVETDKFKAITMQNIGTPKN